MSSPLTDILNPLQELLDRDEVLDLCINGPGQVFVETPQGWECIADDRLDLTWLNSLARAVAASLLATINERKPILSGHLPTGERIQIILPPAAEQPAITIRRPSTVVFSLEELYAGGTFDPVIRNDPGAADHREAVRRESMEWHSKGDRGDILRILRDLVHHRLNLIISGATGSGKTTLSKALIAEIPASERLIAIEDARELVFPQPNVVRLFYSRDSSGVSPVTARELLVACLRKKPDRIMLAELRDEEAYYYLRNVNSGHPGSITTIHANSAVAAIEQLMLMVRQSSAGTGLSRADIHGLVSSLVDVVIQMERQRVTEIHFLPWEGL